MLSLVAVLFLAAADVPHPRPVIAADQSRPNEMVLVNGKPMPLVLPRPTGDGKTRVDDNCTVMYDCNVNHECELSYGCTDGNPLTCCECVGCKVLDTGFCRDCDPGW